MADGVGKRLRIRFWGESMAAFTEFAAAVWESLILRISNITVKDIVDIAIVSVLIYYFIRFIRDRRAGKLAIGVAVLVLFQGLSVLFELSALRFLLENVFQVGIIALIILFQPELRSMLESVGGESLKSIRSIGEQKDTQALLSMIGAVCEAAVDLSEIRTGVLIVIERSTKLGDVIKSGTVVNADTSSFLLKNIFFKNSPLHDGAVVIRGDRVYAAGCLLPLSQNLNIIRDLGTRHRAAIGMSENSDALVIVVSEETGTISMARDGRLRRGYDYNTLHWELENALIDPAGRRKLPWLRSQEEKENEKKAAEAEKENPPSAAAAVKSAVEKTPAQKKR